jgi:glycosyltransferase involved in cell wall biosynthesis
MAQPVLSIIVPVYNGGVAFHQCLEAIVHSSYADAGYTDANQSECASSGWELIVVDDGSTDGSVAIAQHYTTCVLSTAGRLGPATARNIGAQVASGDYLLFVDADCVVHPDTLTNLVWEIRTHPEVEAFFGSYDDAPAAQNFLSQYKNLFHHYIHQTGREDASTFWAGCGAVRRATFWAIGGFNANYRKPCIEDIELGYRLKAAGHQIRLAKQVQVKHLKCWGVVSLLRAEIFYRALPWTMLILRDRPPVNDLNLKPSSRWSVVLCGSLVISVVAGLWNVWFYTLSLAVFTALMVINAPVYRFFLEKRGLWFTVRVVPWHLFYYLYGGVAFAIGCCRYWFSKASSTPKPESALLG